MSGALLADGDRIAFDTIMRGSGVKSLGAFGPLPRHRRDAADRRAAG